MSGPQFVLEWGIPILAGIVMTVLFLRNRAVSTGGVPLRFLAAYLITRGGMIVLARWVWPLPLVTDLDWFRELSYDAMSHGHLPGRDFPTLYGPFFSLLQALGVLLTPGRTSFGVLLAFMAGDLLALLAAGSLDKRFGWSGSWRSLQGWVLLSPALWHQMVLRGQDEVLLLGFLLLAMVHFARGAYGWTGAVMGLGLLCTKVSFLPYAFGFLLLCPAAKGAGRFVVGMAAALTAGLAYVLSVGIPILQWKGMAYQSKGDGISLPDVLRRLGQDPSQGALLVMAVVIAAVLVAWAAKSLSREEPLRGVVGMVAASHAAIMAFMPACLPAYLAQGMVAQFGLGLLLPPGRTRWALCGGSVLLSVTSCLWWTKSHWFGHLVHTVLSAGMSCVTFWAIHRMSVERDRVAAPEAVS